MSDCVKRIIDTLLQHRLQLQCNLDGRGSKHGLRGPVLDLIYGKRFLEKCNSIIVILFFRTICLHSIYCFLFTCFRCDSQSPVSSGNKQRDWRPRCQIPARGSWPTRRTTATWSGSGPSRGLLICLMLNPFLFCYFYLFRFHIFCICQSISRIYAKYPPFFCAVELFRWVNYSLNMA